MKVWLPDRLYNAFPYTAGLAGIFGMLGSTPECIALGGVLLLYNGAVAYLRSQMGQDA